MSRDNMKLFPGNRYQTGGYGEPAGVIAVGDALLFSDYMILVLKLNYDRSEFSGIAFENGEINHTTRSNTGWRNPFQVISPEEP